MSATDAGFYYADSENTPMHVGSVAVFEGPAPTYGDVVRLQRRKLPLVARYRQRGRGGPRERGREVLVQLIHAAWVDDPHFQILYPLRHTAVPGPGTSPAVSNPRGAVL